MIINSDKECHRALLILIDRVSGENTWHSKKSSSHVIPRSRGMTITASWPWAFTISCWTERSSRSNCRIPGLKSEKPCIHIYSEFLCGICRRPDSFRHAFFRLFFHLRTLLFPFLWYPPFHLLMHVISRYTLIWNNVPVQKTAPVPQRIPLPPWLFFVS